MAKGKTESPIYVYPAIFTPEPEGGYYIHFPDIENCFTCGKDIKDGMLMAEDALALVVYTDYAGPREHPDQEAQTQER